MNRTMHMLLLLALMPHKTDPLSRTEKSLQKIKSFFNRYPIEKIDHKEFSTTSLQSISIENYNGPITIKTGWKKNYLCLKTIKRAKSTAHLNSIKTVANIAHKHLSVYTKQLQNDNSGSVEFELIVPVSLTVNLKTNKGSITINDTKGTINATTNTGDITIINTKNNIHAQSLLSGSIYIENAQGSINTTSCIGNIIVHNASNSIYALTQKGHIVVDYKKLSALHTVTLKTISGNISLALPEHTNAIIESSSPHGKIISEHYITLKPYTTQLNRLAWNKLKKEIYGTIGLENGSPISLCCTHGNIKILELKNIP